MELLISAAVHLALFVLGIKAWLWARRQAKAARTVWRRRFGLALFCLPLLLWVAEALLPASLEGPVRLLGVAHAQLEGVLAWALGAADEGLDGWLALVVKPLIYAVFYGGLGLLIGWPLDRWRARRAAPGEPPEEAPEAA